MDQEEAGRQQQQQQFKCFYEAKLKQLFNVFEC